MDQAGWERWKQVCNLPTEKAVAQAMGISEVTLWRVRKGRARPGEAFIALAMTAFDGAVFEQLFTVTAA